MPDQNPISEAESSSSRDLAASCRAGLWHVRLLAGRFRWVICGLLFLGVTKNYIDRQVLAVLKVPLQHEFDWNDIDYGHLVFAFQAAYATGMIFVGWLIDRVGTRLGYALAMIFWSLASMGHALANSLASFIVARFALGFGEAGVFPASIKCVAEWFPNKERALAIGIFNAGTNIGAVIAPFMVPWIFIHFGWRFAFLLTGGLGFAWLILWLLLYRKPDEHPNCTIEERNYIQSDAAKPSGRIRWMELLRHRQTWVFAIGKFTIDPVWWFYLFWIPDYLHREHGLHLTQIGIPILVIFVISDLGSIAGGWLSSTLLRRGFSVNAARKWAMLACALIVVPVAGIFRVSGLWPAALLIGLAAAGHQGFSTNLFTLSSDLFPSRVVASVAGIGGTAGAVGGGLIAEIVGHLLQWTGSYRIPFLIAASDYLVALLLIHLLSPRLEPADISSAAD